MYHYAHKKPAPLMEGEVEPKQRTCLKCSQPFISTGNRVCEPCTLLNLKAPRRLDRGAAYQRNNGVNQE